MAGLKRDIKKKKKNLQQSIKRKRITTETPKVISPQNCGLVLSFKDYWFEIFKKKNCQLSRSKENMAIKDIKGNTNQ